MKGIELKNGCVIYYGNVVGYVDKEAAVVDPMFRGAELERWLNGRNLEARWTNGVYDRLANGGADINADNPMPLKSCRIWQLKSDVDVTMKFIGYQDMVNRFGEPKPEDYSLAYDGQVETNDLDSIYDKFSEGHSYGLPEQPLSISDVIELYDHNGSEFHYVDRRGFERIEFTGQEQSHDMEMVM